MINANASRCGDGYLMKSAIALLYLTRFPQLISSALGRIDDTCCLKDEARDCRIDVRTNHEVWATVFPYPNSCCDTPWTTSRPALPTLGGVVVQPVPILRTFNQLSGFKTTKVGKIHYDNSSDVSISYLASNNFKTRGRGRLRVQHASGSKPERRGE